jgi:ABC-type branched-subunit amino acid transport system substrate-binding protein
MALAQWRAARPARRQLAILATIGLLTSSTAGCGARVPPALGVASDVQSGGAAGGSAVGPGGQTAVTGGQVQVGGGGGAAGPAAAPGAAGAPARGNTGPAAASGGPTAAAQQAAANPNSFNFDPAAEAAACPGNAGNGSSDVGVTPTTITLGNVSGLTGILPNNFNQGAEATQALFASINAHGGICGRQLKLLVEDDGQDASRNAADVADLIPKVFAFVGSTSDADNGGVPQMVQANVPDVGQAINTNRALSPTNISASGNQTVINGKFSAYNTLMKGLLEHQAAPKRIAVLAYSIPISADAGSYYYNAFQKYGGAAPCYQDTAVSPASASLDADVFQMAQKGCDGVFTTMDVTGNGKLLQSMARNPNFKPVFFGTTYDGYTPTQISVAGTAAAQGFQVFTDFVPFNDPNPTMQLYLSQLRTYQPGKQPSAFGAEAWASAQMFVYALIVAGHNPTRAKVVQIMNGLKGWSTGGMTSPIDVGAHGPTKCIVELGVKGNEFVRLWPAQGLYCNGELVPFQP